LPRGKNFEQLKNECEDLLKLKDWHSVRKLAIDISKRFPNQPHGYVWHSIAECHLKNYNESNFIADAAVARFPKNVWVRESRARLAGFKQDWELAGRLWEESISIFPKSINAYVECARAYINGEQFELAQRVIEEATAIAPNHNAVLFVQADIYMAQNNWVHAASKLIDLRNRFPKNAIAYRKENKVLHRLGEHFEALQTIMNWIYQGENVSPVDYDIAANSLIRAFWNLDLNSTYVSKVFETLILQPLSPNAFVNTGAITRNLQTLSQSDPKKYSKIIQFIGKAFHSKIAGKGTPFRFFSLMVGLPEAAITDEELIEYVSKCHLDVFSRLFSSYGFSERNVKNLKSFLALQDSQSLLARFPLASLKNLHIFATTEELLNTNAFSNLAAHIDIPVAAARNIALGSTSKKLRIAVCVSGQFRGYKAAFESWKNLRLDEHDTQFFVHGWYKVGRKLPSPANSPRSFSGAFLAAYREVGYSYGNEHIQTEFPTLFNFFRTSGLVSKQEIMDFYKTPNVVLENDEAEKFSSLINPMKMFYKIQKSWDLAQNSGTDFDLIVRIRPDKKIVSARELDWKSIYKSCSMEPVIFTDVALHVNYNINLFAGDQFAVTTPDLMGLYSQVFSKSLDEEGCIRNPTEYNQVHRQLAYTIYNAGLTARKPPGIVFGQPLDPERLEPAKILMLLKQDINARTPTSLDNKFVLALEADISNGA